MGADREQLRRFKEAAREAGADMSKEEFTRVIGKITKTEPESGPELDPKAEGKDDT